MVVGVFGPTASGKTNVAEALADALDGELVSADAMQAYRGLPVLTNQSRATDAAHRRSGRSTTRRRSVSTRSSLRRRSTSSSPPAGCRVVVGGTGLYLRAALAGLELPPPAPAAVRSRLELLYDRARARASARRARGA